MKDTDYNVWGSLERANAEIKLLRTALSEKETEAWNNTNLYLETMQKLEAENEQLKEELAELRKEDGGNDYTSLHRYKGDPVCVKDGKYYFWDETWSEVSCSFNTIEECDNALNKHCEGLE